MKGKALLLICFFAAAACSKHTVSQKIVSTSSSQNKVSPSTNNVVINNSTTKTDSPATNNTIVPVKPVPVAMIVIDGYGRILTPQQKLPKDAGLKPDYSKIARAFTPQQMANLKARFKTVPPKVLYVPEQYAIKSYKGTYCVYKKTFWYWKKEDGLFYLDENDYL